MCLYIFFITQAHFTDQSAPPFLNFIFLKIGTFTGSVIRLISDTRAKHGGDAVNLSDCGHFVLAKDLSDISDIAHIDLSNIGSLEGQCGSRNLWCAVITRAALG